MECIKGFMGVQKNMNVSIGSDLCIYLCVRVLADLDQVINRAFQSGVEKVFFALFKGFFNFISVDYYHRWDSS
jgi:hypothetical protein